MDSLPLHFSLIGTDSPILTTIAALLGAALLVTLATGVALPKMRLAQRAAPHLLVVSALAALASAVAAQGGKPVGIRLSLLGFDTPHALGIGFEVTQWGAAMVTVVAFLSWTIYRFSQTYLIADSKREKFLQRTLLVVVGVELFALSTNLLGHAALWLLISLQVHWLLRHYNERARARLAAQKKFLISRLADVLFWLGLALLFGSAGTLDIQELSGQASAEKASELAVGLVCLAALAKSAQFPFHSWLPETLDAPTPVSALMHAGVVNAGAFLLLRLSPVLSHSAGSLSLLVVVGGVTAAFGVLVGSVQSNVKLGLAYSTIGQMGFLFLELGLGFAGAAALHLVAHALFKAHAFLRSGTPVQRPAPSHFGLGQSLATVGSSVAFFALVFSVGAYLLGGSVLSLIPLAAVWGLGAAQYLLAPQPTSLAERVRIYLVASLGLCALAMVAEGAVAHWFADLSTPLASGASGVAAVAVALTLLGAAMVLSTRALFDGARMERLYVHALSGFYFGELSDRVTRFLWVDRAPRTSLSS